MINLFSTPLSSSFFLKRNFFPFYISPLFLPISLIYFCILAVLLLIFFFVLPPSLLSFHPLLLLLLFFCHSFHFANANQQKYVQKSKREKTEVYVLRLQKGAPVFRFLFNENTCKYTFLVLHFSFSTNKHKAENLFV